MKEVSIIIVCKNSKDIIRPSIESALKSNPHEVIVVDGNSTDGTRAIVESYITPPHQLSYSNKIQLLTDPGEGIAKARQIGVDAATGKYIFFLGCDNEIEPNSILRLKEYMLEKNWVYCGMLTRIRQTGTYLGYCNNERWKYKITEGEKSIVGTPFIVETRILKEIPYNTKLKFADDTDLCERIINSGYKIGYSDVVCYEILDNSVSELKRRYKMYGISDAEFYNKHKNEWSLSRKWESIMHPYKSEFLLGLKKTDGFINKIKILPYLFLITYYRYKGWYNHRDK